MAVVPSHSSAAPAAVSPAAEAAERLYEAHHERVFAYCLACLRAREEAEDAVQTTFLYALRALERGTVPELELPWLVAIAKNVCLARHRNGRRRLEREVLRDPVALEDAVAAPGRVGAIEGLDDALARLPEQQRRAIVLREWRGLSYREIADELGVSGACVETLIFRARRSLAEQLEPDRAAAGRRVLKGLHLGPLAGLKPLFAGSAAKIAVGAAAVATVVSVAADAPRPQEASPSERAPASQQDRGVVVAATTDAREHADLAGRASLDRTGPEPKGKGKPKAAEAPPAAADDGSGPATGPGAGETVTGAVGGVVEDATGVELPAAPSVSVPELPVDLPPAPELELPPLPVP